MRSWFTLLAAALLTACPETGPDPADKADSAADTSTDTAPPEEGWCGVVEVVNESCASCHSAAGKAGGLDLQTNPHAALVGVASANYPGETLVVAGDSGSSLLYKKMASLQGEAGGVMPPSGALPPATVAVVASWIDAGASSECSNPDTGVETYHPSGWSEPAVHGLAAKTQAQDCLSCHGEDLDGGSVGVSCNTCHPANWQTTCTFCHGGEENSTGAPPENIDDSTSGGSFPAHTAHVSATSLHDAFTCVQCHTTPSQALSKGHFLVGDATAGVADVVFTAGLSASGSWNGATCSNNYCHGDGTGPNGSMAASGSVNDCNACHDARDDGDELSGQHEDHLKEGLSCENCHSTTVSSSTTIRDTSLHVNGTVDLQLPSSIAFNGTTCTGSCHGEEHRTRTW